MDHILNLAVRPNELRNVWYEVQVYGLLGVVKKTWRQVSTAAYSIVWTRWYTSNMSNAMLPHTLAVFAVGSTLVPILLRLTRYDQVRPIYDTKEQRTGGMERDDVRPPASHVVVYIPCSKTKRRYVLTQYFRGFTVVWKRQE